MPTAIYGQPPVIWTWCICHSWATWFQPVTDCTVCCCHGGTPSQSVWLHDWESLMWHADARVLGSDFHCSPPGSSSNVGRALTTSTCGVGRTLPPCGRTPLLLSSAIVWNATCSPNSPSTLCLYWTALSSTMVSWCGRGGSICICWASLYEAWRSIWRRLITSLILGCW
jgi:hypothetical protein